MEPDALTDRVIRSLDETVDDPAIPVDPAGTEFQRSVWRALRDIPLGCTVTYSELAHRIGRPESVRAVAAACGANPIAVIVPCHRVIGKDGSLTGYAWGIERKRMLIDREKAAAR
jgi:O-6-methylguanine DNA methyltransferase